MLLMTCLLAGTIRIADSAEIQKTDVLPAERRLPILMYHSILPDPTLSQTYVITPALLEEDLCWLKEHGYETVTMADVIAFVHGEGTLPARPVMLTFDDGYYNNLVYVQPLLEKYDMHAMISIVGSYTDQYTETPDFNPSYAHVGWEQVCELAALGNFEIQNHSYDMHALWPRRGSDRRAGESDNGYRDAFFEDTALMQQQLKRHGINATTYTYPYGQVGTNTTQWLKSMGFLASLTCYEKANIVRSGDPDCLFLMGRWNRPTGISTEAFMRDTVACVD